MDTTRTQKQRTKANKREKGNGTQAHDTVHSTNPLTLTIPIHTQSLLPQSHWRSLPITKFKWSFRPPTSDLLPRVQPTPHPCHILPPSVIVLINAFPKEVSHGCPARRHILYTRSQTCFTREKSDRSRAEEMCKKGGKGMFSLPPSKISCQIPPTNHPFVPSLCFSFSFRPTVVIL